MSIVVRGMEMPENCLKCPMQFGGWCFVAPPEIDERVAPTVDEAAKQGRPKWCPLFGLKDWKDLCGGRVMTEQEKDRIECAIRHIQTAVDIDPWAVDIAVEAMKTQLSAEGTTSDLISRQDAIDVLSVFTQADALGHTPKQIVEALPSAHQEIEERKEESAQNVPKEDLISRKAAIDAIIADKIYGIALNIMISLNDGKQAETFNSACDRHARLLNDLPSEQPEPKWIPVSERLPESKHEDLEYPTVIVCCGDGAVTLACYYESTKEWGTGEYYDRIINPVAWMPLPEPYRAERRTDD